MSLSAKRLPRDLQKIDAMSILQIAGGVVRVAGDCAGDQRVRSRALGFNKADEITIVFVVRRKALANGVPMANVMFPPAVVGILVLPPDAVSSDPADGVR